MKDNNNNKMRSFNFRLMMTKMRMKTNNKKINHFMMIMNIEIVNFNNCL